MPSAPRRCASRISTSGCRRTLLASPSIERGRVPARRVAGEGGGAQTSAPPLLKESPIKNRPGSPWEICHIAPPVKSNVVECDISNRKECDLFHLVRKPS